MDDKEEVTSPKEHQISFTDDNLSTESGERIGSEIDEDGSSSSEMDGKWISDVKNKIDQIFTMTRGPVQLENETKPKICKPTMHEFSQPSVVAIGPFHRKEVTSISDSEKQVIAGLMNVLYNHDLGACIRRIKKQVVNARECYFSRHIPESFDSEHDNSFTEMLLLDSYFILFMLTVKITKTPTGYILMPIIPNSVLTPIIAKLPNSVRTLKLFHNQTGYIPMPIIQNSVRTLELFRDETTKVLDIIFNKEEIAPDLLILDNQIPFLVIEELFKEVFKEELFKKLFKKLFTEERFKEELFTEELFKELFKEELKLEKILHKYVLEFFETIHPRSVQVDLNSPPKFIHLLDLFYWSRVPKNKYIDVKENKNTEGFKLVDLFRLIYWFLARKIKSIEYAKMIEKKQPCRIPNAMELRESATMFETKTSGSSLVISFRNRRFTPIVKVLDIPELHIRDYSSLIFHNLIAFEMQSSSRRCTMAFSTLMQNMLQSEEDVKLLRRKGILASSSITDNKLVHLFESLSRLTVNYQMPSDLCDTLQRIRSHHKDKVSQICGNILLQYFPNPLVTLSVAAAAMIFVLTLLQSSLLTTAVACFLFPHTG